jgi:succinate dehydrogenase/fumarate reductase flavoprotein subunit
MPCLWQASLILSNHRRICGAAGRGRFSPVRRTRRTEMARLERLGVGKGMRAHECTERLKKVMWRYGAVVRNESGLRKALSEIERLKAQEAAISVENPRDLRAYLEFRNMRLVSEMVCSAALMRTESRGAHFRSDCPHEDESNWLRTIIVKQGDHEIALEPAAVQFAL